MRGAATPESAKKLRPIWRCSIVSTGACSGVALAGKLMGLLMAGVVVWFGMQLKDASLRAAIARHRRDYLWVMRPGSPCCSWSCCPS